MKRFKSKMVPPDRSSTLKQPSSVNPLAATRRKLLPGRRFLFAILSLVVAAFLSPAAKTMVGKSFVSLYKPKLELLVAAFVVVQGEDLANNVIRESTAIYTSATIAWSAYSIQPDHVPLRNQKTHRESCSRKPTCITAAVLQPPTRGSPFCSVSPERSRLKLPLT